MTELLPALPYGFAKRFGVVVIDRDDSGVQIGLRQGDDPRVLAEVRRVLGAPLAVDVVEPTRFDRLLSDRYAGGGLAADAAASIGGDELGLLVDGIPS
ncbi:MAG: type II secretion system protein GspE, partial [Sphingomonadaceae bacterium]|nr:type II secretion system protein GspE [Sphingomonadaceae bacterium]